MNLQETNGANGESGMTYEIRYGANSILELDLPSDRLVMACANGAGTPLENPAVATAQMVADPIGFPALSRTMVSGDRVVVALAEGLPQASAIVDGVVTALLDSGIHSESILLLHANRVEQEWFARSANRFPALVDIPVAVHDPESETELSYLAATDEGKPIYLNRQLCDADIVIPIGLMRVASSFDYDGVHGGLFPSFSDADTQRRYRAPVTMNHAALRRRRRAEVDEVARALGVQLTVQLIPGPGDSVLHVLAGVGDQFATKGQQLAAQAWSTEVPQRASLVVATIEGEAREQTWRNFSRALFAASQVCGEPVGDEKGCIVLCTDLECGIGPALERLTGHGPNREVLHEIRRDRSADAVSASLLVETFERQHVYLLSGLTKRVVEGLQLGYIRSASEIDRLIREHESCVLLPNAHRAVATVSGEDYPSPG